MNEKATSIQVADPQEAIRVLQKELEETNSGLVALTLELEQRVDARTAELREAHRELQRTNSELLQLTLDLEQRVAQRTEEIRRLNEQLEARVKERTAELEVANKELEAFSYSVSHDLRAPLRGIDGFSQAVLDDYAQLLDETGKDYLQRIRNGCQRMARPIDDMLELSRVTRCELRRERVDLGVLAAEIAQELRRGQPERQVEFVIAERAEAEADRGLIRQVLENLLRNAWKFTRQHPRARIEFGTANEDGRAVYFVRDDGAGFDMAYGGEAVWRLPKTPFIGGIRGHGGRLGYSAADHPPPRGQSLGGGKSGAGRNHLFFVGVR